MLRPELEEKLRNARFALDGATTDNIIELCKQYLTLLDEYRGELYRLPATLELNPRSGSSSARVDVDGIRKAVRTAIERTTREREWAARLILSFTAVSGYGAVETLNRQKYEGRDDWELSAGGASFSDAAGGDRMTIQEAVETASLLRREEHVAKYAAAAGACPTTRPGISNPEQEPWKEAHDDSL